MDYKCFDCGNIGYETINDMNIEKCEKCGSKNIGFAEEEDIDEV